MKRLATTLLVFCITAVAGLNLALADHHSSHRAVAVVATTSAWQAPQSKDMGVVYFEKTSEGLRITGRLRGLEPNSTHGFHIHQYGDFSKDDGTSAGGHFSPGDHPHGAPGDAHHHAGDLGNVTADANGEVKIDLKAPWLSIDEGENAILGRAVVVHAGADDLKSQPSGAAGPRIGVGIIGWANPESKSMK